MSKFLKIAVLGLFLSGLPFGVSANTAGDVTEEKSLSVEDQNKKAFEAFNKILEITEGSSDRASMREPLVAAYREIIEKYPKAYLSQESYWRLVTIYLNEYDPPLVEKAEQIFEEFVQKNPDSPIRNMLADTLAGGYYKQGSWEKIVKFYTPAIKAFIQTGKLERSTEMFLYSEAKFHIGDFVEAQKGFKIVISKFPNSREASLSKKRLEEIEAKKSKKD